MKYFETWLNLMITMDRDLTTTWIISQQNKWITNKVKANLKRTKLVKQINDIINKQNKASKTKKKQAKCQNKISKASKRNKKEGR